MTDILELEEFFIEGGEQGKSHVLLHISEPATPEEKQKGYFFALSALTNSKHEQITELQELIDGVEAAYYETGTTSDDKDAFETALELANRRGHRLLEYPQTKLHCLIGVWRGLSVSFAYHGAPEAALICERNGDYNYTDVIGGEIEEFADNPAQLFSSLMHGSLKSGDYFYIATPSVREFFPSDRIQKLITGRTTKETVDHIQKVLGALRNSSSYGGILFHILPKHQGPKTGRTPRYVEPLAKASENGASSSIRQSLVGTSAGEETNYRPRAAKESNKSLPIVIIHGLIKSILALLSFFKRFTFGFVRWCIKLIIIVSNIGGQRATVWADIKRSYCRQYEVFKAFPIISKLLLAIACIFALFFAASAGYLRYKKQIDLTQRHTQEIVAAIHGKRDAADASSIYGDSKKAFALLQAAQGMLTQLPKNSTDRNTLDRELSKQMEQLRTTLQRWVVVESKIVVDIASATGGHPQAERMVSLGNEIIAYGPHDPAIYKLSINSKKVDIVNHSTLSNLIAANTPKEDDRIVFLSGNKAVAEYNKQSGIIAPKEILFPKAEVALADIFIYNQKLFTLDTATKQIYKHAKTQTGYDRGVAWLKTNPVDDLGDAVSMAIDGDIFVLTHDGKILAFTAGALKPFSTSIDPPLSKPAAIWTYNNVQNLYILEPARKRIVVLDKNGTLLHQYSDPQWVNPTGMVVDEAKKVIFVLDSNKIYRFGWQ